MGKKKKKDEKKATKKKAKRNVEALAVNDTILNALANYALQKENAAFAHNAALNGQFRTVLAAEIATGNAGTETFEHINDEDMAYCEGWLDMLRLDLGLEEIPDPVLLVRIQGQQNAPWDFTLSS